VKGAIAVDDAMRTTLADVFAAGDCVHTHHRLLGTTWLPLGTTAHKHGRVAGENALGGNARFVEGLDDLGAQALHHLGRLDVDPQDRDSPITPDSLNKIRAAARAPANRWSFSRPTGGPEAHCNTAASTHRRRIVGALR
jgi:hypothetical protein